MVLSSQRHHASVEFHVRRMRQGMPPLFPELLIGTVNDRQEGLFAHVSFPTLAAPVRPREGVGLGKLRRSASEGDPDSSTPPQPCAALPNLHGILLSSERV